MQERRVVREVGNELANLEMLPTALNRAKSAQVGERWLALAKMFPEFGLIEEVSDIFRAVCGDEAMISRVRPVLEWQYDNADGIGVPEQRLRRGARGQPASSVVLSGAS